VVELFFVGSGLLGTNGWADRQVVKFATVRNHQDRK
jgi:hypothetical protein